MKTAQLIRELRLQKGITQETLAEKTEISVRTIQRIENGDVVPRAHTLQAIATALEVDFSIFVHHNYQSAEGDNIYSKWLPLVHLSGLLLLIIPPILIWIWKRDEVLPMRRHAVDVINYQLSITLYLLPCALLSIYPVLLILGVYSQAMIIINTVKVINHQTYRYPLTIRFLKHDIEVSPGLDKPSSVA